MSISSQSIQSLLTPLTARLSTIESIDSSQETLIANNTSAISNNISGVNSAANFFNNAGYQTATNVNTAINFLKGNPPVLLNTLEKIVAATTYRGQAPYPYALVKGSRWDEENSNGEILEKWFWNGNYWLSTEKLFNIVLANNASANVHSHFSIPLIDSNPTNIFFLNLKTDFIQASNPDSGSYWRMSVYRIINTTGSFSLLSNLSDSLQTFSPSVVNRSVVNINSHYSLTSFNTSFFRFSAIKLNAASNFTGTSILTYRRARI